MMKPTPNMVRSESEHPAHADLYRTLDLLRLYERDGTPVYFIVKGLASIKPSIPDDNEPLDKSYFYDEHSCPTNYVPVEAIFQPGDTDPHGVFEYVRSAWLTTEYLAAEQAGDGDEYLMRVFPEIDGPTIDLKASGPLKLQSSP